jgi:DNA-binding transcriptional LysR family regulator
VTVATYASFASLWLVPRLAAFQAQHPEIEIRIDAADRVVDIDVGDVDVAVRWFRPDSRVDPRATVLMEDEAVAALSPRLLERCGFPVRDPADLARLPLLELDESLPSAAYTSWSRWFEHAGVGDARPSGHLYFTYMDQAVQAAVRGQGAAIVRTPFLDDLLASGDLVAPFARLRMRTGYRYLLLVNPHRARLPHVEAFRAWLVAAFRAGPGGPH